MCVLVASNPKFRLPEGVKPSEFFEETTSSRSERLGETLERGAAIFTKLTAILLLLIAIAWGW